MRKAKKLHLNRETLCDLERPAMRDAAGGVTTPVTHCAVSICEPTCIPKLCGPTSPGICSIHVACGQ